MKTQTCNESIVVGVTGHRNIVDEDRALLKETVKESLIEIQSLFQAKHNGPLSVVMLNGFAQGADLLCAEVAYELGIEVQAVLPCDEALYVQSFTCETDRFLSFLRRASNVLIAPDREGKKNYFKKLVDMDKESYEYRQVGIYIAEQSDVLLALWDGNPPKVKYGCGTAEVVDFFLRPNDLRGTRTDRLDRDGVVAWVTTRRYGDGSTQDVRLQWLTNETENDTAHLGQYAASITPPNEKYFQKRSRLKR